MSAAAGALLAGLIDYAGLFPPAGLAMEAAVAAYASHRRGPERWILSRFVVPVARLGEFEAALGKLDPAARGDGPWEGSAQAMEASTPHGTGTLIRQPSRSRR